jgi:hypothetical protein
MSQTQNAAIAVVGIDIGKNSFHIVGHDERGAIVLRQKWRVARSRPASQYAAVPDRDGSLARLFAFIRGFAADALVAQGRAPRRPAQKDPTTRARQGIRRA